MNYIVGTSSIRRMSSILSKSDPAKKPPSHPPPGLRSPPRPSRLSRPRVVPPSRLVRAPRSIAWIWASGPNSSSGCTGPHGSRGSFVHEVSVTCGRSCGNSSENQVGGSMVWGGDGGDVGRKTRSLTRRLSFLFEKKMKKGTNKTTPG